MNTSTTTTPHTPLETLLLFRGVAQHGLDDGDFVRISEALRTNGLVKTAPTYDARRLNADALRDLFLGLLREELRPVESDDTHGPDAGPQQPASKKRRLQSPPPLTLNDARQHLEKIEAAHAKLHAAYLRHAVDEIRQCERQYDTLQEEIKALERLGVREPDGEQGKPQESNGVAQGSTSTAGKQEGGPANGVGPSLTASPRPPPIPLAQAAPQQPARGLQPLMPHPVPRQDVRNGPPAQLQLPTEKGPPPPRSPATAHPEVVRSPQLAQQAQQEVPKGPAVKPPPTPKPPNGAPQVLQPPHGVPAFQPPAQPHVPPTPPGQPAAHVPHMPHVPQATPSEGLQRPESSVGPRQPPAPPPPNAQVPAQGQLKWEPPYQPNQPNAVPRPQANATAQQQPPNAFLPPSHPVASQRPPQHPPQHPPPQPGAVPLQGQPARPVPPQQVLVPPHQGPQVTPPLQSPHARPPADAAGGQPPNRQQPLFPSSPSIPAAQQPQPTFHPQYPGYTHPTAGQTAPPHPAPATAAQAHAALPPGPGRTGIAQSPAAPVPAQPRPSPGLAPPPQQRPQPLSPQGPPFNQQPVPPGAPSPVPPHPDAPQRYGSPYQPAPRPAAVDRIHPRLPAVSTPTPAARFSPATAPHTPATALPPRLAAGSGTKWVSTSTPSTPKPGLELRLGYDDVPSPAFEPTSPVLRPAALPGAKRDGQADTAKSKPGRPHGAQRGPGGASNLPPAASLPAGHHKSKHISRVSESELPRIKDEATTPRMSTETGDTTADESVAGRPQPPRSTKRKREDLTPTPISTRLPSQLRDVALPDTPTRSGVAPKVVLWTRSFNKVCGSAMEQIVRHRSANMFAAPIREKDAPGYHKVVKQAQDLKTIRAAINHGNRAAAQAAAALPDGDPGTSSVWLPRTQELAPPQSIINSSQLDRELAHMFSNAIMYNPDPHHGPGPAFVRDVEEDEDGADGGGGGGQAHHHQDSVLGYKVDEFGVVNDARAMFAEVEKLLSELRSAEVRRNVPPTGTSTRQASVLGQGGGESVKDDGEEDGEEGEEEGGAGVVKRRRVARG